MDKKEKLYNTWAIADKPLLDMTKRTQRLCTLNKKDSSDETSDPDSDSKDFIALPEEFRPNLRSCPQEQTKDGNTSLNQTSKNHSIQNIASENPRDNYPSKRPFPCKRNQNFSLQNDNENSLKNTSSLLKTGPRTKISYQIVKQDHFHLETKGKSSDETSNNAAKAEKKSISQQKRNPVKGIDLPRYSLANEDKNKKSLKYDYVQTKELRTIQLNFDNLSLQDTDSVLKGGLKYETRLAQNTLTNHKNTTHRENRITKRNTKDRSSLSGGQFSVSSERNIKKWDSSLNIKEDTKIEWTVIREKTSLTVRNVKSQQLNNEIISGDCHTNRATLKNVHGRKFNNSAHKANNNPHVKPKAKRKSNLVHEKCCNSKNFELKNSLSKFDNLNYAIIKNPNSTSDSDTCDTEECICCKQQCAASRQNVENTTSRNSPYEASVSEPVESNNRHRKNPLLTGNGDQNVLSLLQQVQNDPKQILHHNFQNSCSEALDLATVESNSLPIVNKEKNGFSQLQQAENGLNFSTCLNFSRRENSDARVSKDLEDKKESILRYGKEASDLIIGSYVALTMFISFYREWAIARKELILHFEELKKQLKESSRKFSKFNDILQIANTGAAVATVISHPATAMAAKIVTAITSLIQTLLNNKTDKSNVDDSDETARAMLKDNRASSELYMYGLQCSQQFEETTKLIEEFHSNADIQEFFDRENPEITTFLRGFLEFKPNHRIFYKKLHKCFQELLHSSNTYFSRKFCEPFTLYSLSAVDVIGHLRWRFRNEDFDSSSVRYELEEIHRLIQNSSSISLKDLQKRIQNCIGILTDELEFMESIMKDIAMFDSSLHNKTA